MAVNRRLIWTGLIVLALLFTAQTAGRIVTMTPWEDEGFFADPAFTLLQAGYLGTQSVDPASAWQSPYQWFHADRYFYYLPPLYEVMLAAWWKFTGFGLFTMRALSALAGALLCVASVSVISQWSRLKWAPAMTAIFLVTNYHVISAASTGRQDCWTTAFGMAALWSYLALHLSRRRIALLAAHTLVAAAAMTHPNGILFFPPLLYLMWRHGSFNIRDLALSVAPYLVLFGIWGLYISNDPHAFVLQFSTNLGHRLSGVAAPLKALTAELGRYYILPSSETTGRAKVVLTIPLLTGAAFFFANRALRREHRDLAVLLGYFMVAFTYVLGRKWDGYLVTIIPFYSMALAVVVAHFIRYRLVALVFVLICLSGLAATFRLISFRRYEREYLPVVAYVQSLASKKEKVMAAAEFGFGLGFDRVRDDYSLGYYSHARPDTIIIGEWYEAQREASASTRPQIRKFIDGKLKEYRQVFAAGQYRVLVR